jgi:hypothetical protein
MNWLQETWIKASGDLAAAGAILGTLVSILPPIAAILGIVWYVLQIYESHTMREWRLHRKAKHSRHTRNVHSHREEPVEVLVAGSVQKIPAPTEVGQEHAKQPSSRA